MKKKIKRNQRFLIGIGLVFVLLVLGTTWALAQTDGEIHACVHNDGTLYLVPDPEECKKNETPLTWNITGPQGPQGDQGEQGIQGEQGPQGEPGPSSLAALEGTECTFNGYPGVVVKGTDNTTGEISLYCYSLLTIEGPQGSAPTVHFDYYSCNVPCTIVRLPGQTLGILSFNLETKVDLNTTFEYDRVYDDGIGYWYDFYNILMEGHQYITWE